MKKFLTLATALAFALALPAQITINTGDINTLGFVAFQATDTTLSASIEPGGTGAQTWNFADLDNEGISIYQFQEPAQTPFAALFPEANLAATVDDAVFLYLKQDDERLSVLGSYGEFQYDIYTLNLAINFQPAQSIIRFPAQLGDTWEEEVKQVIQVPGTLLGVPFDSIRLLTTVHRSANIDAFGNLTTPVDAYSTIRSTEVETTFDSTFVKTNGIWSLVDVSDAPDSTINYNWWTNENGLGFPVVQIVHDPENGTSEANWLVEFVSASPEAHLMPLSLSPNPASSQLSLSLPEAVEGSVELFDLTGRSVLRQPIQGTSAIIVVEDLVPAMYVAVLRDKAGKLLGSEKVEIL